MPGRTKGCQKVSALICSMIPKYPGSLFLASDFEFLEFGTRESWGCSVPPRTQSRPWLPFRVDIQKQVHSWETKWHTLPIAVKWCRVIHLARTDMFNDLPCYVCRAYIEQHVYALFAWQGLLLFNDLHTRCLQVCIKQRMYALLIYFARFIAWTFTSRACHLEKSSNLRVRCELCIIGIALMTRSSFSGKLVVV